LGPSLFFSFLFFVLRGGIFKLSFGSLRAVRGDGKEGNGREGKGTARGSREGGREETKEGRESDLIPYLLILCSRVLRLSFPFCTEAAPEE